MFADRITVNDEWIVPHFPAYEDRPIEMAMMREWKEYMLYADEHYCGWTTRLVADILAPIPGGLNRRTSRVATTFALWVVKPVGRGFFDPLLRKVWQEKSEYNRRDMALAAWAVENRLASSTRNRLESLLSDGQGKFVYKHKPFPTLPDYRAVEQTLLFFVSDNGREFLRRVCQSCTGNWLPL